MEEGKLPEANSGHSAGDRWRPKSKLQKWTEGQSFTQIWLQPPNNASLGPGVAPAAELGLIGAVHCGDLACP